MSSTVNIPDPIVRECPGCGAIRFAHLFCKNLSCKTNKDLVKLVPAPDKSTKKEKFGTTHDPAIFCHYYS